MFKQCSVADIKNKSLPRENSHLVVAMRFYPRFLKKELRDEFVCDLAPTKELLADFNAAQKRLGTHNESFGAVDYEQRFRLSAAGWSHLKRLVELSHTKDVYISCICQLGDRCHREMLLLMSRELFGCEIGQVFHSYPVFMRRLPDLGD
jgi:uncharacterized protein YeaO (DUF488 family)